MNARQKQQEHHRYEQERRALDLKRMQAPGNWPKWPWLPMKRNVDGDLQCAVFHADDTDPKAQPKLYFINMFQIVTYFPTREMTSQQYESIGAIIEDGWKID